MVEDVTRDGMYVTPTVDFLTKEGAKLSRPMSKGELTMVVSGSPGVPAILNVDACIHDGFVGFRKLNEQKIATEFLYFWFLFRLVENDKHATGAIFRNLTTDQIKNFDVPILTVDQQQQIATHLKAQLAEVEKARQAAGVQLRDARLLRSRILNDIFAELNSIPKKKLGEYAKTTSGSTPSRGNKQYWEAAEIPWVKTGEVAFAPITTTEEAISKSALADCSLTLLPPKTILIAMYGQGKTPLTLAHFGFDHNGEVLADAQLPAILTAEWVEDEANTGKPFPSYARMLQQHGKPEGDSRYSWTIDFNARRAKARAEMQPLLDEAAQIKASVVDLKEQLKRRKKDKADDVELAALDAQIKENEKSVRDLETKAADIDAAVFDLKAVNPNAVANVDTRTAQQIIDNIAEQGRIVSKALANLHDLMTSAN
jgi:hypothetical protein